jgi:tetratricopeptide (TPR) repeat protein
VLGANAWSFLIKWLQAKEAEMKNATFILIIMAAMAIALLQAGPSAQQNRSAEVLMGAGLHQEEVEGDLEAAIATYKKILADYPDNRPVAARALLRMGQCYEKQGNDEARRAYEHLVQVYADQSEPANAARARLAVLAGTGPATLTTRRLENPPEDIPIYGAISPDGRNLSFWDGRTGDLAVRDLQTGKNRRLTDEGTSGNASPGSVGASTWSSDSKRIAYAWLIGSGGGAKAC